MHKKITLYLAHQLKYRQSVRQLELSLESRYNIILNNPFYDSERNDIQKLDSGIQTRYDFDEKNCKDIVENDLKMIRQSDGMLAIVFDKEALGTYMEIIYCARQLKKPVYIVSPDMKIRKHVWIRTHTLKQFESIPEFERWLIHLGYKKD